MSEFKRYFTISEARATLPDLRRRLLRILDLLAEIRSAQQKSGQSLSTVSRGNGKGPILSGVGKHKDEAQRLIEGIAAEGILIKDLEKGLVDFPHHLNGDPEHTVLLCWHLGEDTIEYWHELDAGFAGREKLRPGDS